MTEKLTESSAVDIGFEYAPIGLVVARHRTIERCNARFCRIFDFRCEQLEGQSLSLLYPSTDEFEEIGDRGLHHMREHGCYDDERIMKRRDGELFWCRVRGQSLDKQSPYAPTVWSFADLSENRSTSGQSARERQVAMLLLEGLTSKEVARQLGVSPRTIDAHRARLLEKFHAKNTTELIARLAGFPHFR
jgi:PAS domain S-box-containing protein